MLYLLTIVSNDVESQRRGMVNIAFFMEPKVVPGEDDADRKLQLIHKSRSKTHATIASSMPCRLSAVHGCMPDRLIYHILCLMYGMALGKEFSAKCRHHFGEPTELKYQL